MKEQVFNIRDFGAVISKEQLQTKAIQACIDACHQAGGGKVLIPEGTYLVGSLRLYSHMTLYLESGATLKGSENYQDYEDFHVPSSIQYLQDPYYVKVWNLPEYYFYGMITAFGEENVQIIGEPGSLIDGSDVYDKNGEEGFRGPMGIIMSGVKNLRLQGYTFANSANWSHTLDGCEKIEVQNVTIKAGHDGFNLHHSKDILIEECHLETGDDCFAGYDIDNLLVRRCQLNTACNMLRIGGVNIRFEECTCFGPGHYPHLSEDSYYTHGIFKFYSIDGDEIKQPAAKIVLSKCAFVDADRLFIYDFGRKDLMQNNLPLKSLTLEDCQIAQLRRTSLFKGNGEAVALTLRNVQIDYDSEEPFLEFDESVALTLENVHFVRPTSFMYGEKELTLAKTISMSFNNEVV